MPNAFCTIFSFSNGSLFFQTIVVVSSSEDSVDDNSIQGKLNHFQFKYDSFKWFCYTFHTINIIENTFYTINIMENIVVLSTTDNEDHNPEGKLNQYIPNWYTFTIYTERYQQAQK